MKDKSINIYQMIIIILLQILCEHYLYCGAYIVIALLPLIILTLPVKLKSSYCMLIAFAAGFFTDLLTHNTLGISSASLTLTAAFSSLFLHPLRDSDSIAKMAPPTAENLSPRIFAIYITVAYLIYLTAYNLIEISSFTDFSYLILRILISAVLNIPMAYLMSYMIRRL